MDKVKLFKLGAKIMPHIPYRLAYAICGLVSWPIFLWVKSVREAVLSNMAHVFPEYSEKERAGIGRRMVRNNFCNYVDILRQAKISKDALKEQVIITGIEHLYKALEKGKGVLLVSGHLGSFSFGMQRASQVNVDFNLLVEPIKPPEMYEFIQAQRQVDANVKIIPVGGPEMRDIFRALKRNAVVCVAIDRDVNKTGEFLDFFGEPAPIPLGAAELAMRTGAEIVFAHPHHLPKGKHAIDIWPGFSPVASVSDKHEAARELTARMLREVERMIRRTPESWVVLQPIWNRSEEALD
jgi:KDO2-lipid IV(A) lauroyltransferase